MKCYISYDYIIVKLFIYYISLYPLSYIGINILSEYKNNNNITNS